MSPVSEQTTAEAPIKRKGKNEEKERRIKEQIEELGGAMFQFAGYEDTGWERRELGSYVPALACGTHRCAVTELL